MLRPMRTFLYTAAIFSSVAFPAAAMQFSIAPVQGDSIVIRATGPIISGDMERLAAFMRSLPESDRVLGYAMDSPGGEVVEAEKFADVVRGTHATVGVLSGAECASACFLIFAAAPRKLAAADALIGVHSASDVGGTETLGSLAMTTLMSRDLAELGVPSSIIARGSETEPNRMEWLMPSDLALLGVEVLASTTGQTGSAASAPDPAAPPTSAFDQGLSDRRRWEAWFNSLSGPYQEGAQYWSAQRSLPNPGSCLGPGGTEPWRLDSGLFGGAADARPEHVAEGQPDYRLGWSSY